MQIVKEKAEDPRKREAWNNLPSRQYVRQYLGNPQTYGEGMAGGEPAVEVPVVEPSGRIVGTKDVYGRIVAGQTFVRGPNDTLRSIGDVDLSILQQQEREKMNISGDSPTMPTEPVVIPEDVIPGIDGAPEEPPPPTEDDLLRMAEKKLKASQATLPPEPKRRRREKAAAPPPPPPPDLSRAELVGDFGKLRNMYMLVQKRENQLVCVYPLTQVVNSPPVSDKTFKLIHEDVQYSVCSVGIEFELPVLGLGFQVFLIQD